MRRFVCGYVLGVLCVAGCASYVPEYFGLFPGDVPDPSGRLLAQAPKDDLALNYCSPHELPNPDDPTAPPKKEWPCVAMKREKFFEFWQELQRVTDELKQCQKLHSLEVSK